MTYNRSHALRGNASSDAPASADAERPSVPLPRGAWERLRVGTSHHKDTKGKKYHPLMRAAVFSLFSSCLGAFVVII